MITYLLIIVTILFFLGIFFLVIKYFLKPLFFSISFPKTKIFTILEEQHLFYKHHIIIKNENQQNKNIDSIFYHRIFYKVFCVNKNKEEYILWVNYTKPNSLFFKEELEYKLEKTNNVISVDKEKIVTDKCPACNNYITKTSDKCDDCGLYILS